jgi:hypothetical protein
MTCPSEPEFLLGRVFASAVSANFAAFHAAEPLQAGL